MIRQKIMAFFIAKKRKKIMGLQAEIAADKAQVQADQAALDASSAKLAADEKRLSDAQPHLGLWMEVETLAMSLPDEIRGRLFDVIARGRAQF